MFDPGLMRPRRTLAACQAGPRRGLAQLECCPGGVMEGTVGHPEVDLPALSDSRTRQRSGEEVRGDHGHRQEVEA